MIVTVEIRIYMSKTAYNESKHGKILTEKVLAFPNGNAWTMQNIDPVFVEVFVNRLHGVYLPMNDLCINNDESGTTFVISAAVPSAMGDICPGRVNRELFGNLYIGSREFRAIDAWVRTPEFIGKHKTIIVRMNDGIKFPIYLHLDDNKTNETRSAYTRIWRAVMARYPEWKGDFVIIPDKNSDYRYTVRSELPTITDMGAHDILVTLPNMIDIFGPNVTERLYLHRAQDRQELQYGPAHTSPVDERDDQTFKSMRIMPEKLERIEKALMKCDIEKGIVKVSPNTISWSGKNGTVDIPRTYHLNKLMSMDYITAKDVLSMYLRYRSISETFNQGTMTPSPIAELLHKSLGVKYEGFSGALNNRHKHFCSVMSDVDEIFGSMGPFSRNILRRYQDGNWSINPPYTEELMDMTVTELKAVLEDENTKKDILYTVEVVNWVENDSIDWLKSDDNKYIVYYKVLANGEYYFERLSGGWLRGLSHGQLFSVLSPMGKEHPLRDKCMKVAEAWKETTPESVKNTVWDTRKLFLDKYRMKNMIRDGVEYEFMLEKIESGEWILNNSIVNLRESYDQAVYEIQCEQSC